MAVRTSFTAGEVLAAADLTDTFGAKANTSDLNAKANLASPSFTGTPTAPTAAAGTNTTQLATTAFVLANSGKILQVVRATDTTQRTTTSTSFVDASISVTITPQKSTSAILLFWGASLFHSGTADIAEMRITDASNNAVSGAEAAVIASTTTASIGAFINAIGYSTPATTAATTYKGRFRAQASGTVNLFNNFNTGQLFAIEVSA